MDASIRMGAVETATDDRLAAYAILAVTALGAVAMMLSLRLQIAALLAVDTLRESMTGCALLAGAVEEAAKCAAVAVVLLLGRHRAAGSRTAFWTPAAALRLGLLAGLGAGGAEVLGSLAPGGELNGSGPINAVLVSSVRLTMHGLWGALGGLAVFNLLRQRKRAAALLLLTAAIGLHAGWDRCVGFPPRQDNTTRAIAHALLAVSLGLYTRQLRATGGQPKHNPLTKKPAFARRVLPSTPPATYRPGAHRQAHAA